jgi:hypothetical protein
MNKTQEPVCLEYFILPAFVFFILLHTSIHPNAHMASSCIALGKNFERGICKKDAAYLPILRRLVVEIIDWVALH